MRSGPSERGEHRPFEWGQRVCGGVSSTLGVAQCGRSAGCVLCVLWAMSAAVLGRGVPCGGKHIIITCVCCLFVCCACVGVSCVWACVLWMRLFVGCVCVCSVCASGELLTHYTG